ncbi:heterokaryon incompatibility protein-domain-containing protein [Biscogniauxia mediterranea]|nr:heterokaryon incompatibility protein-domain-containing protein [Biscogniauxia mediterranea]
MDTATILCGLCASIFSEGSYEQWEEEQKAYDGPGTLWRPHHKSSASLKSAAEEGFWIYPKTNHCWGKEQFFVLNSENFSQFTAGIHVGKFPKTFQETMTTVRRLGIKYLWIDCYCIVQGDEEDWKQQASQMDKVYTNSHINIGAANANSPVDGLFSEREGCDEAPPASIRWSPKRNMSPVYFRLCDAWYNHRIGKELSSLSNCTLFRRGWVLQECVLAPRMLTFSRDQIIWQCSEVVACEAHPELGDPVAVRFGSPFWMLCIGRVVKVGGLPENEWLFPDEPNLPEHPGCAGAKDFPRMSLKSDTGKKGLVCLPLFISPTRQVPRRIYGLLLREQDNGAYRRLGAFYSNASATLTELTRYKPQLIVLE